MSRRGCLGIGTCMGFPTRQEGTERKTLGCCYQWKGFRDFFSFCFFLFYSFCLSASSENTEDFQDAPHDTWPGGNDITGSSREVSRSPSILYPYSPHVDRYTPFLYIYICIYTAKLLWLLASASKLFHYAVAKGSWCVPGLRSPSFRETS